MTDTTRTREELITQAAEELMILAAGQELDSEDEDKIDGRIDGLFAELSARGVCDVTDDGAIPIEFVDPLALLLANACSTAFGKPRLGEQARELIEDRLRIMVKRQAPSNEYLKVDTDLTTGRHAAGYSYSDWLYGR